MTDTPQFPENKTGASERKETRVTRALEEIRELTTLEPRARYDSLQAMTPEHINLFLKNVPNLGRDNQTVYDALSSLVKTVQTTAPFADEPTKYMLGAHAGPVLELVIANVANQRKKEREQGMMIKLNASVEKRSQDMQKQLAEIERLNQELTAANTKLLDIAYKDPLTKCYNRHYFITQVNAEIEESRLHDNRPLSLIVFDINDFKSVNDTYDHDGGDQILKDLSVKVQSVIKDRRAKTDLLARLGGDEFALLLPLTDEAGAEKLASRVLKEVQSHQFKYFDDTIHIDLSLGVAQYAPGEAPKRLYLRADKAFYAAQQWGKSQVVSDSKFKQRLEHSKLMPEELMKEYRIKHPLLKNYYFNTPLTDISLKTSTD